MSDGVHPPLHHPVEYEGRIEDKNGWPWVRVSPTGEAIFWTCPRCSRGYYGLTADEPVSGWVEPRWKVTITNGRLTLAPSLGCRGMQDGTCPGHWWVRDGMLVAA